MFTHRTNSILCKMSAITIALVTIALPAEARGKRSNREGFNFGTTLRLMSDDSATNAGPDSTRDTTIESSSQALNPYVGYAVDSLFNFGLVFHVQQQSTTQTASEADGSMEETRTTDTDTKGASLFTRFLFGRVMFIEGGLGLYQIKTNIDSETKTATGGGNFIGKHDQYEVIGVGPGYHVGGGIELPITDGFYFNTAYMVRIFQVRDYDGTANFGGKRGRQQQREIVFGLSHYLN